MPNRYKVDNSKSIIVKTKVPVEPIVDPQLDYISGYTMGDIIFDRNIDKSKENLFQGKVEKAENLKYSPYPDKGSVDFEELGQSTSRQANELELERDGNGYTNPNLHRRIDAQMPEDEKEVTPRGYKLHINKWNSYRTTHVVTHIDYTDLDKYKDDENYETIKIRFAECEKREIP